MTNENPVQTEEVAHIAVTSSTRQGAPPNGPSQDTDAPSQVTDAPSQVTGESQGAATAGEGEEPGSATPGPLSALRRLRRNAGVDDAELKAIPSLPSATSNGNEAPSQAAVETPAPASAPPQ